MKYEYNVKRGDIIMTDVGSAILMRQTRAKWFYLFKNKMISVEENLLRYMNFGKHINLVFLILLAVLAEG